MTVDSHPDPLYWQSEGIALCASHNEIIESFANCAKFVFGQDFADYIEEPSHLAEPPSQSGPADVVFRDSNFKKRHVDGVVNVIGSEEPGVDGWQAYSGHTRDRADHFVPILLHMFSHMSCTHARDIILLCIHGHVVTKMYHELNKKW